MDGVSKPVLYDTYCKAGGCTKGYQRAGFEVWGVDIEPQPRYCGDRFIQMDALAFIRAVLAGEYPMPDAWHSSPPCQGYSRLRHLPWLKDRTWPLMIDETRELLQATGRPWIIENVEDAPLDGVVLCGRMFGIPTYRHRKFESSVLLLAPPHQKHDVVIGHGRMVNDRRKGTLNASSSRGAWGQQSVITVAAGQFKKADGELALGIDWMTKDELAQAIPPIYTEFLGSQLIRYVDNDDASGSSPAWVPCDGCEDFYCQIHQQHAHDCDCPPIEEWITDPYSAPDPPPIAAGREVTP